MKFLFVCLACFLSAAGTFGAEARAFHPESPEALAHKCLSEADVVLLGFEIELRLKPLPKGYHSEVVRVFRVARSLRGNIPENSILHFPAQLHEGWARKNMTVRKDSRTGESFLAPVDDSSGALFCLFLDSKQIEARENEVFVCTERSEPSMSAPLPTALPFDWGPLENVARIAPVKLRERVPPDGDERREDFPPENAGTILFVCLKEDRLYPSQSGGTWDCVRRFCVVECPRGNVPRGATLSCAGFSRGWPESGSVVSEEENSRRPYLRDESARGELFCFFLSDDELSAMSADEYFCGLRPHVLFGMRAIPLSSSAETKILKKVFDVPTEGIKPLPVAFPPTGN